MGGRVRLLEAAAGDTLEGPTEALLIPGGGGVLAGRLLPPPRSGDAALVENFEGRLEAVGLPVEPAALGGDEGCEPIFGGRGGAGGLGQVTAGVAPPHPPAGGRGLLDPGEP